MLDLARGRLRRPLLGTAVVVASTGALALPAAFAALGTSASAARPLQATHVAGFSTAPGSVRVGGELRDTITVLPRSARRVAVQYRRAGTTAFHTSVTVRASAFGVATLPLHPPAAGTWSFRAVVAATPSATALVSPTRTVTATGPAAATGLSGFATGRTIVSLGQQVVDDVVITPRGARPVLVQARRPGTSRFVTQSTGGTSRTGRFRATYRPTSTGDWAFRLFVPASATARSVTSPARVLAVVSGAGGTTSGGGTPAGGAGSPATGGGSPTGGGTGGGNGGGTPAPDPVPAVTTADLIVQRPGYPNSPALAKVTVDEVFAFDASHSVAADGRTLVSGSVDYGDGQTDTFTAPSGPADYWNTVHTYASTGPKTVTLQVTDDAGTTDTTTLTLDVYDAPTAAAQVTSGPAQVNQPVTLALDTWTPAGTHLTSYDVIVRGETNDPAGAPAQSFILRNAAAPPATRTITFSAPGTYTLVICADNDAGATAETTEITVPVAGG